MIDRAILLKLTLVAVIVCTMAAGAALAVWGRAAAGGVAVGAALGLVPFLSWSFIASAIAASPRRRLLAVLLLIAKGALYAAVLYVTVTRKLVDPVGVTAGIGLASFTFIAGTLFGPRREGVGA